jgi:hypothetical protein
MQKCSKNSKEKEGRKIKKKNRSVRRRDCKANRNR